MIIHNLRSLLLKKRDFLSFLSFCLKKDRMNCDIGRLFILSQNCYQICFLKKDGALHKILKQFNFSSVYFLDFLLRKIKLAICNDFNIVRLKTLQKIYGSEI